MKLNVSSLQKKPGSTDSFMFVLDKIDGANDLVFNNPIAVEGKVTNTGLYLELLVHVSTSVSAFCCKCLEEVTIPIELDFSEQYIQAAEKEMTSGETGLENIVLEYSNDLIDLEEAVRDNILLNLPMKILCSPECPGLCPDCGQSLKEGQCQCQTTHIDPRLEILARLKKD